jgi:hypothetical protein
LLSNLEAEPTAYLNAVAVHEYIDKTVRKMTKGRAAQQLRGLWHCANMLSTGRLTDYVHNLRMAHIAPDCLCNLVGADLGRDPSTACVPDNAAIPSRPRSAPTHIDQLLIDCLEALSFEACGHVRTRYPQTREQPV